MSLERESRERNCGWERVRNRRERRERARERTTTGPSLIIDRKWEGHQHSYQRANWREHKDVISFYFTRFREDTTEKLVAKETVEALSNDIIVKLDKSVKIVDKIVESEPVGDKIKVRLVLIVEENIAEVSEIQEPQEEKQEEQEK